MKIDFKQPRYILPLIALPFLCVFFYVYQSAFAGEKTKQEEKEALKSDIADVSDGVKNTGLADKLAAYRQRYREGDGYTAIGQIREEQTENFRFDDLYNEQEKRRLDSLEKALDRKHSTGTTGNPDGDRALAAALNALEPKPAPKDQGRRETDPMELFRRQMAYADSMAKANDPEQRAEAERLAAIEAAEREANGRKTLPVSLSASPHAVFNTITAERRGRMIHAIIDENITGYAGSRLRIRLLDDIMAGRHVVKRGTYVYAEISGFTGQRVTLSIRSIMQDGKLLPVRLEVYDNDGSPGLYVPASAFREFSRELGASSTQGVTLQQQAQNNNQLVMGVMQRMFQSTTAAVGKLIRSNKAKLKYNTQVFLIDPEELKQSQGSY
jgi:Protein of unknown function (DUF3714).